MAEGRDELADFFDLSKEFKVMRIIKPTSRRIKLRERDFLPPMMNEDDNEVFDQEKYWKELKEKERAEMLERRDAGYREGSVFGMSTTASSRFAEGSRMSGIEANTMTAGSVLTADERGIDEGELLKRYNFSVRKASPHLPIARNRDEVIDRIANNQVTVITGYTGCGKTTQIPQYILEDHAARERYVNIIVTQPRRIAAQSVARRVCQERDWKLGGLVGYKVGLDKEHASPDTRLLYVTTGVLKKMLIGRKQMNEWTHVILDEVHEREEDMDFLLLLCKRLINTNSRGTKLILMSATVDVEKFRNYFSYPLPNALHDEKAAMFEFPKTKEHEVNVWYTSDHQIEQYFQREQPGPELGDAPELFPQCINVCKQLLEGLDTLDDDSGDLRGSVLIFLPGEREIMTVRKALEKDNKDQLLKWWILPLHSRIPVEEHQMIFEPPRDQWRKVILSTNMAESSITIPDIRFVFDFCLTKLLKADPETNYVSLKLEWADKQSCEQRAGRAGRVADGSVFRMVSRTFFETELPEQHLPEMMRAPLDKVILDTKLLDFGPPKEVLGLAMDPPELQNIFKTTMHLKEIGALLPTVNGIPAKEDGDLTVLGEIVASLPVDVLLGKLIVYGHVFNVLEECVIIAAGLSNKSIFTTPFDKKLVAYANKLHWADRTFSDCIAVLIAYRVWQTKKRQGEFERAVGRGRGQREQEWCRSRFLQLKALREMEQTIDDIWRNLKRCEIENRPMPNRRKPSPDEQILFLQIVIFGAFYPNYFVKREGSGIPTRDVFKQLNGRDPMSSLYLAGFRSQQAKCGMLYAGQIRRMFQDCVTDPSLIDVEFDGSKVIVQFARCSGKYEVRPEDREGQSFYDRQNLTGEILHHVYVGMKLRFAPRECLRLDLHTDTIAEQKYKRLVERMDRVPKNLLSAAKIGQVDPPRIDEKYRLVEVVWVTDPNSFWIQFNENSGKLNRVADAIEHMMRIGKGVRKVEEVFEVKKHNVYLAPFHDGEEVYYYRARVDLFDERSQGRVFVFFIDYGNNGWVSVFDMYALDPKTVETDVIEIPGQAVECSLALVKPNQIRSAQALWDKEATTEFQRVLYKADNIFMAEIYSVVPGKDSYLMSVKLFHPSTQPGQPLRPVAKGPNGEHCETVNRWMTVYAKDRKGRPFGEDSLESFLSQENHDQRERQETFSREMRDFLDESQRTSFKAGFDFGDESGGGLVVTYLRPPEHPLRYDIACAHRVGSTKVVSIEPESVNSVLLDRFPGHKHDLWMVGAHVGMTPSGNALQVRGTTFMPYRPGLGAILAMIFAPEVEMRCDRDRKRYTGCLIGLGSRERDWGKGQRTGKSDRAEFVSYHPEHDMEIDFDVKIDNGDIQLINKVRYWLCSLLSRPPLVKSDGTLLPLEVQRREGTVKFQDPKALVEGQDKVREYLDTLLNKQRLGKEKEVFGQGIYRWREFPERHMLNISGMPEATMRTFFLKPIAGVQLQEEPDHEFQARMQRILEKLMELDEVSKLNSMNLRESCPVCENEGPFRTSMDLRDHNRSFSHQSKLDDFEKILITLS